MSFQGRKHIERFRAGMAVEELRGELARIMAHLDYRHPASDLGYCTCGTVWNIDAMAAQSYVRGTCPECGEDAAAIEKAAPQNGG